MSRPPMSRPPMYRCLTLLAFAALVLAMDPAIAGDAPIDCDKAYSTHELNYCQEQEFDRADAALNKVYQQALKSIPSRASDESRFNAESWTIALRSSQRAWVAFRDAECNNHVPMFWTGGTGTTVAVLGCMSSMTKDRTAELRENYDEN